MTSKDDRIVFLSLLKKSRLCANLYGDFKTCITI